jgi:hypothetical protein
VCRLLVDTMVWNYVAKAHVLPGFVRSIASKPVLTPYVVDELKKALPSWPELRCVIEAVEDGPIELIELEDAEHILLSELRAKHIGLNETDCSLLALASSRRWEIVTCDGGLRNVSQRCGVVVRELADLLSRAVASGCITLADRDWIAYFSKGGTRHRS